MAEDDDEEHSTQASSAQTAPPKTAPQAKSQLQLADLQKLIKLVEYAADKGAFPIAEYTTIHEVHTRTSRFIADHVQNN